MTHMLLHSGTALTKLSPPHVDGGVQNLSGPLKSLAPLQPRAPGNIRRPGFPLFQPGPDSAAG
jgi:hypothetical protein